MELTPPDPPDPPDPASCSMDISQPLFSQAATKRRLDSEVPSEPAKRSNNPSAAMSSPSSQPVYTHPSLVIAPKVYSDLDKGPFIVHVSRIETEPNAPTFIQPIRFGKFLVNNKIKDVINDGIKKIGRNRISVEFTSASAANKFLSSEILSLCKYSATIPTYNVTRMGLIKQIPSDLPMEELAESLTIPDGCGILLKARRLNRKVTTDGQASWVPTQSVVVTFKGQVLPKRVFLFHNSIPVETYQLPTIQCLNCCRFGHVKAQCRSKARCFRCTQPHSADNCDITEEKATCIHCTGPHFALNKSCPEHSRQKAIKIAMSQDNISYAEASAMYPTTRRSYADITKSPSSQPLPSPSQTLHSQTSHLPLSYKKTIPRSPRSHAPLGKGYDRQAHQAIIGNCASSLPNGCALTDNPPSSFSDDINLLDLVLTLILRVVTQHKDSIPSNVAQKLSQISQISNYNGNSGGSVELSEH
ncbi:uncharacterized protein LOC135080573 [Ostrinia nubilalis]|uniref:uncharacterized protein LOC135080573 n=1 Tax=Ostrinia nubilalis TaxID=29057 RepID=UPI0030825AB6